MNDPDDDNLGERLISREPVIVRRRVHWGECDPAQVVYTPRFADYGASAVHWFWRVVLPDGGSELATAGLITPVKHMAFTFQHVLRPNDVFDMTVRIGAIRTRTLDILVDATGSDGSERFSARFTPILVSDRDFESRPIPSATRQVLEAYHERFPGLAGER